MEGMEVKEKTDEIAEGPAPSRFHQWVAICVAFVAVFMAMCKVKDDNIVQAMMQAQADKLDQWNQYQAESMKQHLYRLELERWDLMGSLPALGLASQGKLDAKLAAWKTQIDKYEKEKTDLKKQADASDKEYNDLNYRDDQFDFSDALLGLAIALFAVSSLSKSRMLFGLGSAAALFGMIMGLAAFCQWHIHPGVIRFLT